MMRLRKRCAGERRSVSLSVGVWMGMVGLCVAPSWSQGTAATRTAGAYGIEIGPETTYVTEPLLADGMVDYAAAINAETGKGVTPENNAACLIARIVRAGEDKWWNVPDEVLTRMGVDQKAVRVTWTDSPGKLDELITARDATGRPWTRAEIPELGAWLESNRGALDLFAEASGRSQWWAPIERSGDVLLVTSSGLLMNASVAANAMALRSMMKLGEGDENGAWEDLAACERMAGLMGRSPDLTGRLTAAGMHQRTRAAMWRMIEHGELPAEVLQQMEALLEERRGWPADGQVCLQSERYQFLMQVAYFAKGMQEAMDKKENGLGEQFRAAGFKAPDWNRVMRMGNALYDMLQKDQRPMSAEERAEHRHAVTARFDELTVLRGGADPTRMRQDGTMDTTWLLPRVGETQDRYTDRVGAAIVMMMPSNFDKREGLFDACNESLAWTRVAVALVRYQRDQGGYPEELKTLLPKYMEGLPENNAERPVRYERMGKGFVLTNGSAATTGERSGVRVITIQRGR